MRVTRKIFLAAVLRVGICFCLYLGLVLFAAHAAAQDDAPAQIDENDRITPLELWAELHEKQSQTFDAITDISLRYAEAAVNAPHCKKESHVIDLEFDAINWNYQHLNLLSAGVSDLDREIGNKEFFLFKPIPGMRLAACNLMGTIIQSHQERLQEQIDRLAVMIEKRSANPLSPGFVTVDELKNVLSAFQETYSAYGKIRDVLDKTRDENCSTFAGPAKADSDLAAKQTAEFEQKRLQIAEQYKQIMDELPSSYSLCLIGYDAYKIDSALILAQAAFSANARQLAENRQMPPKERLQADFWSKHFTAIYLYWLVRSLDVYIEGYFGSVWFDFNPNPTKLREIELIYNARTILQDAIHSLRTGLEF